VRITHPKYVKAPKGKKSDPRDARRIAELFCYNAIAEYSFIPPPDILNLRDIHRHDRKISNIITGEKNRLQNVLTISNIKIDEVLSDVFGKTAKQSSTLSLKTGVISILHR
jgi:hypothetical protein